MALGLIAVFAAIVYKLDVGGHRSASLISTAAPVSAELAIPAGDRVVSTALDGDRALLTLAAPDGTTSLLLVDLASGSVLGRYSLAPE